MSDGPLIAETLLSPNRRARTRAIDTVTIHHAACVGASAADVARLFLDPARRASSNYCIGTAGEIVLCVPEAEAAMTSSSAANDGRAVTIEVANCGGAPDWPVSDAAMEALAALCADICRRNGIDRLRWQGDKALVGQTGLQNMTVHRWFAQTACPGDYLYNRMGEIASAVNARLAAPQRVDRLADAPDWARPTLRRLLLAGCLRGTGGTDEAGLPAGLDLSADMLRLLVVLERAGAFRALTEQSG